MIEQLNKEYFEKTRELLAIIDKDGRFIELSKPWAEILGWSIEELKAKKYTDLLHPEDINKSVEAAEVFYSEGKRAKYFENRYIDRDGNYVWLQWDGFFFEDRKMYAVARDITLLKEKEFFFEEMQKISKIGCWKVNLANGIASSSSEIFRIYEKDPNTSLDMNNGFDCFPESTHAFLKEKLNRLIEKDEPYEVLSPFKSHKGTSKTVRLIGKPLKTNGSREIYGLLQDVTTEVEKQKELDIQRTKNINASKMASLGEMAANIGHEINNPLSLIQGRAEHLKSKILDDKISREELLSGIDQIQRTSIRIAKIIKSLRFFAKTNDQAAFVKMSLRNILEDTLVLCSEKLKSDGYDIRVEDPPNVKINCRGAELCQVFLNLINNSVEATAAQKEKWISVAFKMGNKDICIEVSDSGQGIDEPIRDKIMQPFFTTKEKGTGLGLSIANSIVISHQGKIYYDHTKTNTTFCIELPLME